MTRSQVKCLFEGVMWAVLFAFGIVLAFVSLSGCGGYAEDPDVTELGDEAIEVAGEPLPEPEGETEKVTGYQVGYGWRRDLSGSNARCLGNGAQPNSQVCVLPPNKTIRIRVTGTGMSASQKTLVESLVDGWILRFADDFNTYSFSRVTVDPDINISFGEVPGSITSSIHTYAHANQSGGFTIDDFGSPGTWEKYGLISCTIDNASILADFDTVTKEDSIRSHAVDYCVNKAVGIGSGGSNTGRSYAIATTPGVFKGQDASAFVRCQANSYQAGDLTIIDFCGVDLVPCPCAGLSDN